jgi:hypothetical protein
MASAHQTGYGFGGAVVALGAVPGGFGVSEVVDTGHSVWGDGWFLFGGSLWCVAAVVIVVTTVLWGLHVWKVRHPVPAVAPQPSYERHEHKTRSENWEVTEWEETRRGRDVAVEAAAAGATAVTNTAAGEVQSPVSPDSPTPPSVSQGVVPLHHI